MRCGKDEIEDDLRMRMRWGGMRWDELGLRFIWNVVRWDNIEIYIGISSNEIELKLVEMRFEDEWMNEN